MLYETCLFEASADQIDMCRELGWPVVPPRTTDVDSGQHFEGEGRARRVPPDRLAPRAGAASSRRVPPDRHVPRAGAARCPPRTTDVDAVVRGEARCPPRTTDVDTVVRGEAGESRVSERLGCESVAVWLRHVDRRPIVRGETPPDRRESRAGVARVEAKHHQIDTSRGLGWRVCSRRSTPDRR